MKQIVTIIEPTINPQYVFNEPPLLYTIRIATFADLPNSIAYFQILYAGMHVGHFDCAGNYIAKMYGTKDDPTFREQMADAAELARRAYKGIVDGIFDINTDFTFHRNHDTMVQIINMSVGVDVPTIFVDNREPEERTFSAMQGGVE